MAKFVLRDCFIEVDAVDLSDHADSVSIETTFDEADASSFGATYKEILQGLGDATITVGFKSDFAAASVDATLWPLSQAGDPFDIVIRPTSAPASATNPEYTMTSILTSYSPLSGSLGDVSSTEVTFRNASQAGITKATT